MKMWKVFIRSLIVFVLLFISDTRSGISPLFGQDNLEIITPENAFQLRQMESLQYNSPIESIAFNPDASRLASGHINGEIRVAAINGGDSQVIYSGNPTIKRLLFNPDGTRLISSGTSSFNSPPRAPLYTTVQIWDVQAGTQLTTLIGDRFVSAKSISIDPRGYFVTVASLSGKFNVWMTGDALLTLTSDTDSSHYVLVDEWWARGDNCSSVAFDPTGKLFACGGLDGTIALRHWDSFEEEEPIILNGHSHKVAELIFGPDGLFLVSRDIYGSIRLWDTAAGTGQVLYQIPSGLQGKTNFRMALSPDAQILAVITTPDSPFSKDPEWLTVRLWSTKTGDELVDLHQEEPVTDIAFSPDGTRFATASWDGSIRLWGVS